MVVLSYLKLLDQNVHLNESRIEWLWHVKTLIQFMNEKRGVERIKLIELLTNSKNPVLQVYGTLAKSNLI